MSALDELADKARWIMATAGPATVAVGRDGRGSGLVLGEGRVVTNAHNLRDRTTLVTFADGRAEQAELVAADVDGDLAVLAVGTGGAVAPPWSERPVGQGDWVFALAAGGRRSRVTVGMVSGRDRTFRGPRGRRVRGSVEHTAPLARGSSGGPLLDVDGRLVGINTHRVEPGFYLALPADTELRQRVDRLAAGVAPLRRRLGIALAPVEVAGRLRAAVGLPARDGLLVRAVEDASPAATADIRPGDLLVAAAGTDLRTADDLFDALEAAAGSPAVTIRLVRGTDELTVEVAFPPPSGAVGDAPSPSEA